MRIEGSSVTAVFDLGGDGETEVEEVQSDVNNLNDTSVVVPFDISGPLSEGWIASIQEQLDELNDTPVEIETNTEGDAETNLPAIRDDIESLPATQDIEINQTGDADSQIETIKDDAEAVPTEIDIDINQTGDAESSIEDTKDDADDLSDSEEQSGQAGEDAGNDISDGMGVAATGITAVSAEAENLTQELYDSQTAMQQLAIFTGETNSQMTTLVNNVTSASVSQQAAEQYIQTLMQLGVPNQLLEQNADELAKIGEATGNDSETTAAFAQTVVALGGDAQQMGDYIGMAGYEQQNFVGGLANFSQMAPMFATQMTAMGFSTEQAAVIMADMSQKTGGTRKGMMALITAANGSGAALLNELNTTTPAVNAQADSFGNYTSKVNEASAADEANQSWLAQLQTDYTKLMLTLGDIGPEILTIAGAIGALVAGPSAAAWVVDKLFQTDFQTAYNDWLKDQLEPVTDLMKSALQKAGIDIGDSAETAGDTVSDDIGKATEDMGDGIKNGFSYVNETIDNSADDLSWGSVEDRFDTDLVDLESDVVSSISKFGSGIVNGIKDIGSSIKSAVGGLGDSVTEGSASFDGDFDDFINDIKSNVGNVTDSFKGSDDGVIDMFQNLDGTWQMEAPNFLEKVVTFGKNITSDLTDGIKLPDLPSIGAKIPDGLSDGIMSALPKLVGDAALPLAVVTTGIQGVYQYSDTVKEGPIGVMLEQWGLSLPAPLAKIDDLLSPDNILGSIMGQAAAAKFTAGLNQTFNVPIMNALNPIPGEVVKGLSGIPNDITNAFKGTGGNPLAGLETDIDGGITDIEKDFDGFKDYLTNIKLPTGYDIGKGLVTGLTDVVWGVVDGVKDIEGGYNDLKSFIEKLPGELSSDAKNIWTSITNPIAQGESDTKSGLGKVQTDFVNFENYIKNLPGEISADASSLWTGLKNDITQGETDIKNDLGAIQQDFTNFESFLKNLPATAGADVNNLWNTIKTDFNNGISWFTSIPSQLETDGKNAVDGIEKGVEGGIGDVEHSLSDLEMDFMDDVKWIEDLPGEMLTWGENAITGFVKGITSGVPGLNDALKALSDLFPHSPPESGPLADVTPDNMTNYADTLMNGFITGVTNNVSGVLTALKTIASLFPHSPVESGPLADVNDTNMSDYGSSLMTALATGISNGTPAVTSALQAVSNDITSSVNSDVSAANSEGSLNPLSVTGSNTSTTDSTLTALTNTATTAASALTALTNATQTAEYTETQSGSALNALQTSLVNSVDSSVTPILSSIEQAYVASTAGESAQAVTVNFHPNSIQLPEGVTPDSARAIAGAFGDEVAKRINRGAISNGIKPYSIYNNPNLNK